MWCMVHGDLLLYSSLCLEQVKRIVQIICHSWEMVGARSSLLTKVDKFVINPFKCNKT